MVYTLSSVIRVPLPRSQVFEFFANAENLGKITPPALDFVIHTKLPIEMRVGALIDYTVKLRGLPIRWQTRIAEWNPPHHFVDEQLKGPYAVWIHRHSFREVPGATEIRDDVEYVLPFGIFGRLAHFYVKGELDRIFTFRQAEVRSRLVHDGMPLSHDSIVHGRKNQ